MIRQIDQNDDIKAVHIKLNTNNEKKILLKANMFVFPDGKTLSGEGEGYPFACLRRRVYNADYFEDKSHFERVQVFFNKKAFETFLSKCLKVETKDVSRDNMLLMLNLLFPISFPISDQVTSLFDDQVSIMDSIANVFRSKAYAYLKVENVTCTVTQVVWLDTLTKNPTYIDLKKLFVDRYVNIVRFMEEKSKKGTSTKDDKYDQDVIDMSKYIGRYNNGEIGETDMRSLFADYKVKKRSSLWWKLHFIFENLKKETRAYDEFVTSFTKEFAAVNNSYHWEVKSSFQKALSDLDFYFDYVKKLEMFMPPYRESMNSEIAHLFREEESRRNIDVDEFMKFFQNDSNATIYAGIDIIKERATKSNDYYYEQNETKSTQTYFEIQLVISLIEGEVNDKTSDDMLCQLKSQKLMKDYEYLSKYKPGEVKFYPYITTKEMSKPGANTQKSFASILKSVGGRRRKRTNKNKKRRRISKTWKR
jgi:hypothetical protein